MSTTGTSPVAPEVRLFLARVRHELADLDGDDVIEMTDGLEADLTELVAERGAGALGSPVDYAGELRAAAGLAPATARPTASRAALADRVSGWLDGAHARFDAVVAALPGDARPVVEWLRPLWWILRAWIAAQAAVWFVSALFGVGYYEAYWTLVPSGMGAGWLVLAAAVAGSIQMGRGRLWPDGHRGPLARTVLLALNALAIVLVPVSLAMVRNQSEAYSHAYNDGYSDARAEMMPTVDGPGYGIDEQAGVYASGSWVTNIYPYDASGQPLVGVQLFNQNGDPISVVAAPECPDGADGWTVNPVDWDPNCYDPETGEPTEGRVPYPWTNGAAQLENVFPLPTRMQQELEPSATAFAEQDPPAIGEFPLASVPPVSLPGIAPTVVRQPEPAAD